MSDNDPSSADPFGDIADEFVEAFGGEDKILSRAVNVRPAFPCKRMWVPP